MIKNRFYMLNSQRAASDTAASAAAGGERMLELAYGLADTRGDIRIAWAEPEGVAHETSIVSGATRGSPAKRVRYWVFSTTDRETSA